MKGMHGIIFSYEKKTGLRELIEHRIHGSVPIGGEYRVVDFMLSNMVNAGIQDVGIIMQGRCQSMLDHLGNGKSWDLSRKRGGLTLLPAFAYMENHDSMGQFRGKVEALEFRATKNSAICGKPLMSLKLQPNLLIGAINRNGQILTPGGKDTIEPGDMVVVVTTITGLNDLDDILDKRR